MKSKAGQNRNVFVRIITCPIRALSRARDLYVRSLTECATGASHNSRRRRVPYHPTQYSSLPRSLSAASSISNNDGAEDLRELMRAASVRVYGHKNEAEMYVEQLRQLRQQEREAAAAAAAAASAAKVLPKSVSVGMGFMGRIDEDKACEEFEDGAAAADGGGPGAGKGDVSKKKGTEKYPRSKSYAPASKRLAVF